MIKLRYFSSNLEVETWRVCIFPTKTGRFGQKLRNHRDLIREYTYLIKCCSLQTVNDKNDHAKSLQNNFYQIFVTH